MMLLSFLLYLVYLPFSGCLVLPYDAAAYWDLAAQFSDHRHFSLLHYANGLRGYLYPLLLFGPWALQHTVASWATPLLCAQMLGAGWAGLLFGLAIPQLWAQATGRPLTAGRWLMLLSLAFVFWRDHFNFTLSDVPALTLLLLGLGALGRSGRGWGLAAGALIAASINTRPIYIACVPGVLALLAINRRSVGWWCRCVGLVVGSTLVLLPQGLVNWRYFQQATPLVLAHLPGRPPLYLRQLGWGTSFQRFEASLLPAHPAALVYADPSGQQALAAEPGRQFADYGHYLRFVACQPLSVGLRYGRHLFNGLDLWHATPYVMQLHPIGQDLLRLLNYLLWGVSLGQIGCTCWHKRQVAVSIQARAVLLAVLLPCALSLPTLIECRFLLPLHLLLLASIAATAHPRAWWDAVGSAGRRGAVVAFVAGWLWGCWQVSENTAQQLRPSNERPHL